MIPKHPGEWVWRRIPTYCPPCGERLTKQNRVGTNGRYVCRECDRRRYFRAATVAQLENQRSTETTVRETQESSDV